MLTVQRWVEVNVASSNLANNIKASPAATLLPVKAILLGEMFVLLLGQSTDP